ncbi:hypothetical protein NEFER03_1717 [Nematocida sp. LUAm3]|nr:hypothetical protein NEFER03_1717 [Nematocida sp. LUAm3]KAI5175707.1 hypothetical protein NEFER02_1594 [Nematocida sp. LUAm2]KAI5178613.1 hypothetical protein NEFER01_1749 [Nematocida sp. LUAm1]
MHREQEKNIIEVVDTISCKRIVIKKDICLIGGHGADIKIDSANGTQCSVNYKENILSVSEGTVTLNGEVVITQTQIQYPSLIRIDNHTLRVNKTGANPFTPSFPESQEEAEGHTAQDKFTIYYGGTPSLSPQSDSPFSENKEAPLPDTTISDIAEEILTIPYTPDAQLDHPIVMQETPQKEDKPPAGRISLFDAIPYEPKEHATEHTTKDIAEHATKDITEHTAKDITEERITEEPSVEHVTENVVEGVVEGVTEKPVADIIPMTSIEVDVKEPEIKPKKPKHKKINKKYVEDELFAHEPIQATRRASISYQSTEKASAPKTLHEEPPKKKQKKPSKK